MGKALSGFVLVVAAIGGGWYAFRAKAAGAAAGEVKAPAPSPVSATVVSKRDIPIYLDGLGTIQAYNTVTIHTQVDGQLIEIGFKEGQQVKKGDLLAKIDPQPLQAQLDQADAKKKQDEAKLIQDQAHTKQDEAKINQDKAKINQDKAKKVQDQASLVNARLTLTRDQAAFVANAVTQQSVDDQRTQVAVLEATLLSDDAAIEADEAAVEADQAAVQADQATIQADHAFIQADEAATRYVQTQLAYTTILSPIDGVTGIRIVDVGNIVRAVDANGIVVVTQLDPISLVFTLPQQHFSLVSRRMAEDKLPVMAMDPESKGELGRGILNLIDNQIDTTTGTIRLKATFPNTNRKLWPGAFVNARLLADTHKDALMIAAAAVQQGADGDYVYLIKPDDTVDVCKIKLDRVQDGEAIVASGLEAGEKVVLSGQDRLKAGSHVSVQTPKDKGGKAEKGDSGDTAPPKSEPNGATPAPKEEKEPAGAK